MNTSKLVNDYVKAYTLENSIAAQIREQTQDLQDQQKIAKAKLKEFKAAIVKELANSNSKRLESTTNFVVLHTSDVKAHVRKSVLVNKEPK